METNDFLSLHSLNKAHHYSVCLKSPSKTHTYVNNFKSFVHTQQCLVENFSYQGNTFFIGFLHYASFSVFGPGSAHTLP